MAQFGSALTATREEAQKMIAKAVAESSNLAEAMESVGAMYGIPSSNILVDDNLKSVKVINDTIVCPSNVSAANNSNTIVRSISTLLDQISSRIDEKINGLQAGNIADGRFKDSVLEKTDPSKGKVVATHKDANGEPVIVYDSGIIDAPNTPEGRAKANELRAAGNVPAVDPLQKRDPSYFTDEDDVMNGVPVSTPQEDNGPGTQYTPTIPVSQPPMMEYSIADKIGESDYFIDAMSRLNTSRLGQTLFTTHGYERILPSMNVVQEAASGSKTPEPKLIELKHMKFDNSNLIKAVNLLNKARAEQSEIKNPVDLNVAKLIRNPDYNEAIRCVEKQFDCHLSIRYYDLFPSTEHMSNVATEPVGRFNDDPAIGREITKNITISKSKGFQMGGSSVDIHVFGKLLQENIPKEPDLFGQGFMSIMLHEIFHNIVAILRFENIEFTVTSRLAIERAIRCRNPKQRKVIIDRYVDCLNSQMKGKLPRPARRLIAKRILASIAVESDEKLKEEYSNAVKSADEKVENITPDPNHEIQKVTRFINKQNKYLEKHAKSYKRGGATGIVLGCVFSAIGVIASAITLNNPLAFAISMMITGGGVGSIISGAYGRKVWSHYKKMSKIYEDSRRVEEYYCDLFAAMYQLPVHWFIGGKYRSNDISKENLKEYSKALSTYHKNIDTILKPIHDIETGCYPTEVERIWTGTVAAKKMLEVGHLDPAVKRYLEWILQGDSSVLDIGIDEDYNYHNFSPEEAKDLDKHINDIVRNNNLKVTEQAIQELVDTSEFVEWVTNGMKYDEEEIGYMEYVDLIESYDRLIQEALTATKVTGYRDESFGKRLLLLIPRLFKKIIEIAEFIITKIGHGITVAITKMRLGNKQHVVNYDFRKIADVSDGLCITIRDTYDKLDGLDDAKDYLKTVHAMRSGKKSGKMSEIVNGKNGNHMAYAKTEKFIIPKGGNVYGHDLTNSMERIMSAINSMRPYLKRMNDQYSRLIDLNSGTEFTDEEKEDIKYIAGMLMEWSNLLTVISKCLKDMTIDGEIVTKAYQTTKFIGPNAKGLQMVYNDIVPELNAEQQKKKESEKK